MKSFLLGCVVFLSNLLFLSSIFAEPECYFNYYDIYSDAPKKGYSQVMKTNNLLKIKTENTPCQEFIPSEKLLIFQASCNPADRNGCLTRYQNCISPIDNENDPGASEKFQNCWDDLMNCLNVNGC
jgi:hypothetical protein